MSSPEGPLRSMLWTAATHALISLALVVAAGGLSRGLHQYTPLPRHVMYLLGGMGAGWAHGLYVGRELGEPDRPTNLGSVLDIAGAVLGVLIGLALLSGWGWLPL